MALLIPTVHTLRQVQRLPLSLEKCWEFFSNAQNLAQLTPPHLMMEISGGEDVYAGMILKHSVAPFFGLRLTWVTEITHVDKPALFVDEQRFGPFVFWHHQHHFRALPAAEGGGVEMVDLVHYAVPGWILAPLVRRWLVAPELAKIFAFRDQALARLFPAAGAAAPGAPA